MLTAKDMNKIRGTECNSDEESMINSPGKSMCTSPVNITRTSGLGQMVIKESWPMQGGILSSTSEIGSISKHMDKKTQLNKN